MGNQLHNHSPSQDHHITYQDYGQHAYGPKPHPSCLDEEEKRRHPSSFLFHPQACEIYHFIHLRMLPSSRNIHDHTHKIIEKYHSQNKSVFTLNGPSRPQEEGDEKRG